MRTALLIAAALTTAAIPFGSAHADTALLAVGKYKGPKGLKGKNAKKKGKHDDNKGKHKGKNKGKKPGKGHGSGGDDDSDSGESGADTCELPNGVESMVKGAGQRLSFTFAGKVWVREGNTSGSFFLAYHPQSPGTAIVHVSCRYNEFSDVNISAAQTRFRMSGSCRQVFDDGRIESASATNDVIINNGETDSVSITTVGGGLSVPPGALSFGNFQMSNASDPPAPT